MDQNSDGRISMDELRTVLKSLADWTESELEALMRCLDANSDGQVTLDEYMSTVCKEDVVVRKLVKLSRSNWNEEPRAERKEWKQKLENDAKTVKQKERDQTTDKAILLGAVADGTRARQELLRQQPRALRLLLSSTFTDTNEERNFLLADVLPYLQEYARRLGGFEAQIVEMRWGIRDEAADNHETSEICMEELERCLRESVGVSYVLIAAQKYGFRPFPNKIPKEYFEQLLGKVERQEDRKLLEDWFQLDENEVAQEEEKASEEWEASAEFRGPLGPQYVLKSKAGQLGKDWWPKFKGMQKALRDAARLVWPNETSEEAMKDPSKRHYAQRFIISVTEEEFTRGLLLRSEESLKKKRALVIKRHLQGLEEAADVGNQSEWQRKGDFIDVLDNTSQVDSEVQKLLKAQVSMAPKELIVFDRMLPWGPGINLRRLEHIRYLKDMADCVCKELADSLLEGAKEVSVVWDEVVEEAARHLRFALERAGKFYQTDSTRKVTDGIEKYLHGDGETALVVWGKSGAGKTYLMSRMVSDVIGEANAQQGENPGGGVFVVRFLGTTPASSSVRDLLESVCGQLSRAYEKDEAIPSEFKELVKLFRQAVVEWPSQERPLTLVLDSVDQLDNSNGGRKLEWLPVKELGNNTKLVVTTLPDYKGLFQCKSLLEKRLGDPKVMLEVETISNHDKVFEHLLGLQGRRVTKLQMKAMSTAFTKRSEKDAAGTPLWLTIVAQAMSKWRSFDDIKFAISSSVLGLIQDLFKRLKVRHGEALVHATLGYITLCQGTGLSESELVHLLSLNDDVLAAVYVWWVPPHRMLPALVVSRLLGDLKLYLSRRGDGSGAELVVWYHRQFWEAAEDFLFEGKCCGARRSMHRELADYFGGKWSGQPKPYNEKLQECVQREKFFPGESEGDRMVPAQPLVLSGHLHESKGRQFNVRRLTELVHHLICAGEEELAIKELCSIAYVAAKFAAKSGAALMREFGEASEQFPESRAKVQGWRAFVGRNLKVLQKAVCPLVPFQLALQEPDESDEYKSALRYSEEVFAKGESALLGGAFVSWAHVAQKPQAKHQCVLSVEEHEECVSGVVMSPDGKWIASCSEDKTVKICSASTGEVSCTMEHDAEVRCIDWSKNGQLLASGCNDGTIHLWTHLGEKKCTLTGHSDYVRSVAFSPDGKLVASGSDDETVKVWDVEAGSEKCTLTGHSWSVTSVAFSPDGKTIASGSDDQTVKLWDVEAGSEKCTLKGTIASWQNLDPHTKELAAKVKQGGDTNRTGHYIVTADDDMVHVYLTKSDGEELDGEQPLACFLSPARVSTVSCMGTSVVVGCTDGQVQSLYSVCGCE